MRYRTDRTKYVPLLPAGRIYGLHSDRRPCAARKVFENCTRNVHAAQGLWRQITANFFDARANFLAVICHLHGRLPPFYLLARLSLDKFQYIDFDFNYGLLTYSLLRRACQTLPDQLPPSGRLPPKILRRAVHALKKLAVICHLVADHRQVGQAGLTCLHVDQNINIYLI